LFKAARQASMASPTGPPAQAGSAMDRFDARYKDGFILVEKSDDSRFPFQLKLNNTTQFRYINTQLDSETFTVHCGTVRPVAKRNHFSINRSIFTFSGFAFDKRLKFSLVSWTSNTLAAVVVGGYVGWEFNKALTLQAGYWTVPGSRTLSYTFPY